MEKNERISRLKAVNIERGELFEPAVEVVRLLKLENQLAKIDNKKIQKEMYVIYVLICNTVSIIYINYWESLSVSHIFF